MNILGIANNDVAGACLVRDGYVVSAVSEERFTRKKNDIVWPSRSIDHVLSIGGIDLNQVDCISYGWNSGFNAEKHLPLYFDRIVDETRDNLDGLLWIRKRINDEIRNDKQKRQEFDEFLTKHNLIDKAFYIDHHECHALGAFVCSPFNDALVITCDGRGDFQSLTVSRYSEGGCEVLQRETTIDSLGYFYGRITHLLGFKPNRHEGKVTGLAPYGNPEKLLPLMQRMIDIKDGGLRANCGDNYQPSYNGYSSSLKEIISREKPEDVAAAAQQHMENILADIVRRHIGTAGNENVCLAGGVFGNVKLNQRIQEVDRVNNVYVLPCMGDGGLPLAAAVGAAYLKDGTRYKNQSMKLGPDAGGEQDNLAILENEYPELMSYQPEDMITTLVEALNNNQVLGVFKGKMEFGPRALCNRSIIYHAADADVNDWLNKRMGRTEFMPFAPVTALEHASSCYLGWREDHVVSDSMTMTYDCHPELAERCPAVVHVDGTARPQVIRPESDPFIHSLLLGWYQESGQPALINTSFNKHEEPIVCDVRDAFDALRDRMVDFVVLSEKTLVWKKGENNMARLYFE
ncbi:carbamoyltransferase [Vreelandella zhaodongensis]|uniref:Carbamoyl transferase n=1 Tax=Vreelandella zhaodongensis TaxID=1176240 RepID=A0ABX2SU63_VREZH|nr:carbamoyltransferase C-terminal domain-containing protein [Halomonas zhaodongensis]NYS44979.1 carbamoyl transferase [Halomonas zhaodongensis]